MLPNACGAIEPANGVGLYPPRFMAIRGDGSVMSPPPGFVTRGCKRAFLVADGRDVTAVELFEWCYPRR